MQAERRKPFTDPRTRKGEAELKRIGFSIDRYLARGLSKSKCVNTRKTLKYA